MALIQCPECKTEISDKAASCVKCGHPINPSTAQSEKKKGVSILRNLIGIVVLLAIVFFVFHVKKEASKPQLPVEVKYRKALLSNGLVALFKNTSNHEISVLATFTNPKINVYKSFKLDLSPNVPFQFGHLEGWNFEHGDIITLENNGYSELKVSFP
jgi:hypothetical protein